MCACRRLSGAERFPVAAAAPTCDWRVALALVALLGAGLPAAAVAQAGHGAAEPAGQAQPAEPHGQPAPAEPAHGAPAQDPAAHAPAEAHAVSDAHAPSAEGHGDAAHGESLWSFIARILNFLLLVGGLYYLLRRPLANYLDARSRQIRSDLDHATHTREESKARQAEIEARLKALPGEIEAMRARGKHEIEVEQARIRETAEAERARLVEQTSRAIDRQVQIARRDLTEHAANLAIDVARTRLATEMTDADQLRLVDRYVTQVSTAHD
jgi:F-type H+-transporting ATPase subunit b